MLIGILIIILLLLVNLVVIIISLQNQIMEAKLQLQDSIRSYMDIIPLLLLKSDQLNKSILQKRSQWFNDWHNPEAHWPVWTNFDHTIDDMIIKFESQNQNPSKAYTEAKNELRQREYQVRSSTHDYNSLVIKYKQKLSKKLFNFAKKLDFKFGSQKYQVLADF